MRLKELWDSFCGSDEKKRDRVSEITFKPGTRPAIILERLCEGSKLSGWSVCKMLRTHNGDRDLRRVREWLRSVGIDYVTYHETAENGRQYKVTQLLPSQAMRAHALTFGKRA